MSRVRLTERARRRRAVDGSIPYPGNVNQPDRRFKDQDQYDNWDEVINHPLPDLRHEWQDNPRDEIGYGIPKTWGAQPTVASVKVAADKAVRVAILLLGERTSDDIVEDQARDLIMMGSEALDRTIARFTDTQNLYVAEDDDEKEEEAKEAAEKEDESDKDEESKEAAEKEDDSEKEEESKEAAEKEDESDKDEESKEAAEKEDDSEKEEETKEASDELANNAGDSAKTVPEQPAESTGAQEAKSAAAPAGGIQLEPLRGPNEMDIELQASTDSEFAPDAEADALLASIFDDGNVELPEAGESRREASAKQGVQSLGGQPKVASSDAPADISNIWSSLDAPDVSKIFN